MRTYFSIPKGVSFLAVFLLFSMLSSSLHAQSCEIPPTLVGVPSDVAISCSDPVPVAPAVTAINNCEGPDSSYCVKIENQQLTNGSIGDFTYTFTYDSNNEPTSITITSGGSTIDSITIKGGTESVTYYGPFVSLTAPINPNTGIPYAISNITFCIGSGGCPGNAAVVFAETTNPGSCAQSYTIVRTWTATDPCGNVSSASQTITVDDNTAPTITCPPDITVGTDAGVCGAVVSYMATGSDDCGNFNISYSQASGSSFSVGTTTVTATATDECGNSADCSFNVTVNDTEGPNAVCQDITVYLDQLGLVFVTAADIDGGSSDACGNVTISTNTFAFGCGNVGENNATLTVTDVNGNSSTCTAIITVEDTIAPLVVCNDITISLDANGQASIDAQDITASVSDNCGSVVCGFDSNAVTQTDFDCSSIGVTTVTLTATDVNGNSSTCTAEITVDDNIAPVAVCQDITVQLDANGSVSINASDVDGGSSDNCDVSLDVDPANFDCSDLGANSVTLTATDNAGNSDACTANVTVVDDVAPTAVCQDITVQLDANGAASITASDLDGGSSDNCAIASITATPISFDCSDLGINSVTLTVTDQAGNISTCTAEVTVEDNIAPTITCPADITVGTDEGQCSAEVSYDVNVADNCSATLVQTSGLASGSDFPVGTTQNSYTATDVAGNTATCDFEVTVVDDEAPEIICPADLAFDCVDDVPVADPNDALASDNCPGVTITVSESDNGGLGCSSDPLDIQRTYTATDNAGNTASCVQNIQVALDTLENGTCDGGANNCEASISVFWDCTNPSCVFVTSCKDLSNVVLRDCAGDDYKFEFNSSQDTATICHSSGLPISTVWVKSGCFLSGDGPGYGLRFDLCASNTVCASAKTSSPNPAQEIELRSSMNVFPNPFGESTNIEFQLDREDHATLQVYDLHGKSVQILMDQDVEGGISYAVDFSANGLSSGIYLLELRTESGNRLVKKLHVNK